METRFEIEVRLAGPVQVLDRDGSDATPRGAKARGIIVLLALAPSFTRSRAYLQDKLWSDRAPEQAAASLRQALSELRQKLNTTRDCLVTEGTQVRLDPDLVHVRLDLEQNGAASLGEAPELAEGLEIPDPEFEHWIRDRRLEYETHFDAAAADVWSPPSPQRHGHEPSDGSDHPSSFDRSNLLRRVAAILPALLIALIAAMWIPIGRPANDVSSRSTPLAAGNAAPSIAVLPFETLGGDAIHAAFVEGVSRDVVTDLSKFGTLFVIAANSSFRFEDKPLSPQEVGRDLGVRYVLTGSVQWLGDQVRVNAQLVETKSANHIWAERFDRPADDLLKLQNEIVRRVVDVIGPVSGARGKLRAAELERLSRVPTENLQAYDFYLQGIVQREESSPEANARAQDLFERAGELDPRYAKAFAMLAWSHVVDAWNGWTDDPGASIAKAEDAATRAMVADPSDAYSHWALASVRLFQRRHDESIPAYRKSVELNPNAVDLLMYLGWALTYVDEPDEGIEIMERAIERNPYYPGYYLWDLAWGQFIKRDYAACVTTIQRRNPMTPYSHLLAGICQAMLDDKMAAEKSVTVFLQADPGFTVAFAEDIEPFESDADLQHYLNALRAAGVPEGADDAG